jgi:hypothetical protein
VQDVVKVGALEVGDADGAQLAGGMGLLRRSPDFEIALKVVVAGSGVRPWRWAVMIIRSITFSLSPCNEPSMLAFAGR